MEDNLITKFASGVSMVALLPLALSYPTLAAAPHMFLDAYKNVLAVALATEYSIPQAETVKEYLKGPNKFDLVVAAPMVAESTTAPAASKEEKKEEPEVESDEEMGLGLFASGVSMVASLSLAISYPTLAAAPHMFANAYNNVRTMALATDYNIPQIEKVKQYLKDSNKFDVAIAAPMAAESAIASVTAKEGKKEVHEEEFDEGMGFGLFASGVSMVDSLSLALSYPTLAVAPHMFLNAYKNVIAVALATKYSVPQAEKVKEYLKDPNRFAASVAAPMVVESATAPASTKEERKEEPEVESDEEIGLGLFASGVSMVASLSLALSYPTLAAALHMFQNAYKNVLAVALVTEYSIPQANKVKVYLKDPKFVVAVAAPMAAESTTSLVAARDGKNEEPEKESDEDMGFDLFAFGVSMVASLSLALSYPTLVATPHMFLNAYKNVLAVALETEYSIPQAEKVKEYLKDPNKFDVAVAAPMAAESTTAPIATKAGKKEEPEEESDEDIGFDLFASGVSKVASLSLALSYPTLVVAPDMFLNAYKSVLNVALATEYSIPQADKVKVYLKDPNKFVVDLAAPMAAESATALAAPKEEKKEEPGVESNEEIGFGLFAFGVSMDPNKFDVDVAAPMAAESTTAPVAAKEWKKEEPEEESDEDMGFGLFASGVSMVASLSLALLYPTLVVAPHMFLNAYKNVLAVALETEYSIPQAKKVKECLKDPNKFVVAVVAPMAAESTTAPITAKEGKKEEPEEESDEDIGFDLFASGVSKVASLSLALSYPTLVVAPDMFLNAYKNVLAVALAIEYSIPQADKVKVYLKKGRKVAEEESEEDMGFGLCSSVVSMVASLSFALSYPTLVAAPHMFLNAYKNVLAVALATEYSNSTSREG